MIQREADIQAVYSAGGLRLLDGCPAWRYWYESDTRQIFVLGMRLYIQQEK